MASLLAKKSLAATALDAARQDENLKKVFASNDVGSMISTAFASLNRNQASLLPMLMAGCAYRHAEDRKVIKRGDKQSAENFAATTGLSVVQIKLYARLFDIHPQIAESTSWFFERGGQDHYAPRKGAGAEFQIEVHKAWTTYQTAIGNGKSEDEAMAEVDKLQSAKAVSDEPKAYSPDMQRKRYFFLLKMALEGLSPDHTLRQSYPTPASLIEYVEKGAPLEEKTLAEALDTEALGISWPTPVAPKRSQRASRPDNISPISPAPETDTPRRNTKPSAAAA